MCIRDSLELLGHAFESDRRCGVAGTLDSRGRLRIGRTQRSILPPGFFFEPYPSNCNVLAHHTSIRLRLDVVHYMLDARVILETIHGKVLSVPGFLESTVRHFGDERNVCVDPHAAKVQVASEAHRATMVTRPHR